MNYEVLTPRQALEYFGHPSQVRFTGATGDMVDWMEYRACSGVCVAFQPHMWPGVWMGHLAALPGARGRTDGPLRTILAGFTAEVGAERVIGWIKESNRAMLALCRRAGFEIDGRLPLSEPVIMVGWRP